PDFRDTAHTEYRLRDFRMGRGIERALFTLVASHRGEADEHFACDCHADFLNVFDGFILLARSSVVSIREMSAERWEADRHTMSLRDDERRRSPMFRTHASLRL